MNITTGSGSGAAPVKADEIVHELDGCEYHRLIVNGVPGEWFPPSEIAFNGNYYAATMPQGSASFPIVFSVREENYTILSATEDIGGDPK